MIRLKAFTIFKGIVIHPSIGEGAALLGPDGINPTAVVFIEHRACTVGTILENKSPAVWRDLSLVRNEVRFAHSEMRGNLRRIVVLESDNPLDPAARPALPTLEILVHLNNTFGTTAPLPQTGSLTELGATSGSP